jgi:hypothetical protein
MISMLVFQLGLHEELVIKKIFISGFARSTRHFLKCSTASKTKIPYARRRINVLIESFVIYQ